MKNPFNKKIAVIMLLIGIGAWLAGTAILEISGTVYDHRILGDLLYFNMLMFASLFAGMRGDII